MKYFIHYDKETGQGRGLYTDETLITDGQLRTLQRRVKEWRKIMARELIYGCTE